MIYTILLKHLRKAVYEAMFVCQNEQTLRSMSQEKMLVPTKAKSSQVYLQTFQNTFRVLVIVIVYLDICCIFDRIKLSATDYHVAFIRRKQ